MQRLLRSAALVSIACLLPCISWAGDQEISQQIADSLRSHLKNYSVGVKVQDGTVWLNGYVASQRQMSLAVETAQKTPGIERVVNNLSIGSKPVAQQGSSADMQQAPYMPASQYPQQPMDQRMNGYRQGVQPAGMELPEHARQELMVAGPLNDSDDDSTPAAANKQPSQNQQSMSQYQQSAPGYFPGRSYNNAVNAAYAQNAAGYGQGGAMRPMSQQAPLPIATANGPYRQASMQAGAPPEGGEMIGAPQPLQAAGPMGPGSPAPYHFDHPQMPGYAWPSYAAYPNYAAVTYPKQYSPTAWPYIGPFYPYPQVPLGWRKVSLEWEDGWWFLDFKDSH
jgi:hypothetical protein